MSYADVPNSVRSLEQRIRNLEGTEELAIRRRVGMSLVVVGQMFPREPSRAAARWRFDTVAALGSPRISTLLACSRWLGSVATSRIRWLLVERASPAGLSRGLHPGRLASQRHMSCSRST